MAGGSGRATRKEGAAAEDAAVRPIRPTRWRAPWLGGGGLPRRYKADELVKGERTYVRRLECMLKGMRDPMKDARVSR